MHDFAYHRPTSLAEAAWLMEASADGRFLAGGQSLIPVMKQRLARPTTLIDLAAIADLHGIDVEPGRITVAAMTTHAEVAGFEAIRSSIPALAGLAARIGDPQVRNRGTIGGAIAHNDPAADYPAALLALGATIRTTARAVAADDFFTGLFSTALRPGEIVTAVEFPVPARAAYVKVANPASRYAIVGVFVAKGRFSVRVAVTGAGPGVFRVTEMERALAADFSPSTIAGLGVPADGLSSDIHASAGYRAHLIEVLARRAVTAA